MSCVTLAARSDVPQGPVSRMQQAREVKGTRSGKEDANCHHSGDRVLRLCVG